MSWAMPNSLFPNIFPLTLQGKLWTSFRMKHGKIWIGINNGPFHFLNILRWEVLYAHNVIQDGILAAQRTAILA